mmetsp:Transcript_66856/g.144217  ORF Transcript_66856/g.144217 Transcript_66856/m.144217 type:complete len:214 (+) Transcript_66856:328-969(+)
MLGQDLRHHVFLFLHIFHRHTALLGLVTDLLSLIVAGNTLTNGILTCALTDFREIGASELLRALGEVGQVHVRMHGTLLQHSTEDGETRLVVGHRNVDELIQTTRTHQSRIDDIRSVSGSHNKHILSRTHSVHLGQQLIHDTIPSPSPVTRVASSLARNGVKLVKEQHTGCRRTGLLECLTHISLRLAEPHGKHLRSLDRYEVGLTLVGHSLG